MTLSWTLTAQPRTALTHMGYCAHARTASRSPGLICRRMAVQSSSPSSSPAAIRSGSGREVIHSAKVWAACTLQCSRTTATASNPARSASGRSCDDGSATDGAGGMASASSAGTELRVGRRRTSSNQEEEPWRVPWSSRKEEKPGDGGRPESARGPGRPARCARGQTLISRVGPDCNRLDVVLRSAFDEGQRGRNEDGGADEVTPRSGRSDEVARPLGGHGGKVFAV